MVKRTSYIPLNLDGTLLQDHDKSSLLFFDIETTGFTAGGSVLYLIGAVTCQDGSWIITQWLAEHPGEEADILQAFLTFAKPYSQLLHFNGERFDLPYLQEKCKLYGLRDTLSTILSRDLYRMIRPLKALLKLPALNQRCLEEHLGLYREDPYNGGELIEVYKNYIKHPTEAALQTLLLHNHDDLSGMLHILPLLSYQAVLAGDFRVSSCEIINDSLVVRAWLPLLLPKAFSFHSPHFYITGERDQLAMEIRGVHDTLKYFFQDYKNYYYLPQEDMAIHKSIASFVDREHRQPAKASNCYNWKKGFFLPQFETLYTQVFRYDYQDKQMYFQCRDSFLQDGQKLHDYMLHLLAQI